MKGPGPSETETETEEKIIIGLQQPAQVIRAARVASFLFCSSADWAASATREKVFFNTASSRMVPWGLLWNCPLL